MLIRDFVEGDEARLAEVYYQAVHQTAAADYSPQQLAVWAPADRDPAEWARKIQAIRPFVAEFEGGIAGYADVQLNGYIDHFFVAPRVARRGVGAALMRRIHDVAASRQITRLFSNVSITARPFFERFGFVVDVAQVVVLKGIPLNNFQMSKLLIRK